MFNKGLLLSLIFTIGFSAMSFAQDIVPKGNFQQDSVEIGVPLPYSLSVKYPKHMNVVFPDSLHDFTPFEFESKQYFNTHSDSTMSYDSAVYYLSSFEVDSIQTLRLPIFLLHGKDSARIWPNWDTVRLVELVPILPDSVQLKENTAYLNTPTQFNYPYYIIALIVLGIVAVIAALIFGKPIRRKLQLRRLRKQYEKFIFQFDRKTALLSSDTSITLKEELVNDWKKYLEKIDKRPYTKLTTKELSFLYKENDTLQQALNQIDRAIYGNFNDATPKDHFEVLKATAVEKYQTKITEIKSNG